MDLDAVVAARVKQGKVTVPPSPVVALRLMQLLDDPDSPLSSLVAAIEQDQSLAAIVLRVANSPVFRRLSEVVSLAQAVTVLGRGTLREVSVAKELHERSLGRGALVALRRRAWRESYVGAHVAARLAPMFQVKPEEAYVAALLHDIGRVPAIGIIEKLLTEHPDADTRSEDGWWAAVEEHHVALGTLLAHAWKLPALVGNAIERHHGDESTPLLEVLRIADQVVRLMDGEPFVPAERLGAIAALSTDQCRELATFLPMLPATLDAFREPLADQPASAIDYELNLVADLAAGLDVSLAWDGLVNEAPVLSASEQHLVVRATLSPGRLVRVTAGDARFHARVAAVAGDQSELRPYALDEEQAANWASFLARREAA